MEVGFCIFSVSSSFIAACTVVADIVHAGVFATVVAVWSQVFVPLVFPITTFSASVTKLSSAQRDRETTGAVGSVESTDIFVPPTTLSTCPPPPPPPPQVLLIVKLG